MKDEKLYLIHVGVCIQKVEEYVREGVRKVLVCQDLLFPSE